MSPVSMPIARPAVTPAPGYGGASDSAGSLGLRLHRPVTVSPNLNPAPVQYSEEIDRLTDPSRLPFSTAGNWRRRYLAANRPNIERGLARLKLAGQFGIPTHFGTLLAKLTRHDGDVLDFGLVSCRMVTTVGCAFVVNAFLNVLEPEIMKYHGIGTGGTAESASDTALVTEVTTGLNPDNTRATGTNTAGGSSNVLQSVGTNIVDATLAITEHGLFSQAATGGGTLFDRTLFAAINMVAADQLQTTYSWTLAAGG